MTEYRYSERGRIKRGDVFRARRCDRPGRYKLLAVEQDAERIYLLAVPVDRHGIQSGGQTLLFVSGPDRQGIAGTWSPCRVARCRR